MRHTITRTMDEYTMDLLRHSKYLKFKFNFPLCGGWSMVVENHCFQALGNVLFSSLRFIQGRVKNANKWYRNNK